MECVAYMRVSTERQAEEGLGLESQKRDIENYARKNALIITDWYVDDGYTGSNMDRPQLQRLVANCTKKRVKCVVAFKLDRLSRSMVDGIYLIERVFQPNGIDFRCVHDSVSYDSPMEQAYTQMMAVFAQLDKNTMLLRMRGGMLERVKQGHWMGGGNLPYCYTYSKETGTLVPIPERAEQARQALQLFIDGCSDVRIKEMLGFQHERTVHQVLTSPVNIGMIPYKGELYQGLHEPIFDREQFDFAQQLRKARGEAKSYSQTEPNMLTGICYCGTCGCKMRYQKWTGGRHKIYCYSRDGYMHGKVRNWKPSCKNSLEWADEIEKKVESAILKISLNLTEDSKGKKKKKSEILESNLSREQEKLKRLYMVYAEGNDAVKGLIRELESKIRSIRGEIKEEQEKELNAPKKELVFSQIKRIADVWEYIDNKKRNKLLKIIVQKIVIVNGNVEIILRDF